MGCRGSGYDGECLWNGDEEAIKDGFCMVEDDESPEDSCNSFEDEYEDEDDTN